MDTLTLPAEVVALIAEWPEGLARTEFGTGSCIESTRVAVPALKRLGIEARPLACGVAVLNAAAMAQVDAGNTDVATWPPDAWSVGIDPTAQAGPPTHGLARTEPFRRTGGWSGHLVVGGDGWFCDLTARQFHRPDKGIVVPGAVWGPLDDREGVHCEFGDTTIRYYWQWKMASWRNTPAWRGDIPIGLIDAIVASVRARLGQEG